MIFIKKEMLLSDIGENGIIKYVKEQSYQSYDNDILIGIGDDAGVINLGDNSRKLLVTTDLMTEGIHFDLSYTTYYQLGFKLISINVSDIYAMNGSPRYVLLALSFPVNTEVKDFNAFIRGIVDALKIYKTTLIGGDTCSSLRDITISATVLGYASTPISRNTAKVGDKIYVTGYTGDSACGMELLKRINKPIDIEEDLRLNIPLDLEIIRPLIKRHLMPYVKMPDTLGLKVNSMMDISDGLAIDLKKLCDASRVGAVIYTDRLPISQEMQKAAQYLGLDPQDLCLRGGEDYKYLFTSSDFTDKAFYIGEITEREFCIIDKDYNKIKLKDLGYEHFK